MPSRPDKAQQEDISPTKEMTYLLGREVGTLWLITVRYQCCSQRDVGMKYCGCIQVTAHTCDLWTVGRTQVKFMELYSWRVAMVLLSLTSRSFDFNLCLPHLFSDFSRQWTAWYPFEHHPYCAHVLYLDRFFIVPFLSVAFCKAQWFCKHLST